MLKLKSVKQFFSNNSNKTLKIMKIGPKIEKKKNCDEIGFKIPFHSM